MLRMKRKKLRMSQIEASKVLGIDNTYLSLIENKKRCPMDDELIEKICSLYNITIDEFSSFISND